MSKGDQAPTGQELLEQIAEQKKTLTRENIELSIQNTQIGSRDPWPPLDLQGSAQGLLEGVADADVLSIAELVTGLDRVAVRLSRTTSLVPVLGGDRGWLEVVVPAVFANGLIADPRADVELRYLVQLGGGNVTTTRGGEPVGQYGAYSLRTDVSLALPARVRRGPSMHHADVEIGNITAISAHTELPSAEFLKEQLYTVTAQLFAKVRADQRRPDGAHSWGPDLVDTDAVEAWAADFRASHRGRRSDLDPGLYAVGGFSEVQAKATHPGGISGMGEILKVGALNARWTHVLGEAGIPIAVQDSPALRHDWILSRYTEGGPLKDSIACASRSVVQESDCLAMLNGKYVRFAGMGWVDRSQTKMVLSGNASEGLWQNLNQTMRTVIGQLQTGRSKSPLAAHKDTQPILEALERVKRTEVPDVVTRQLANRIAQILDNESAITVPTRSRWIMNVEGKPWYNLAAVGEARRADLIPNHVQEAVTRAIHRIQYEDPIALFAFDRPFSHSRDGDYVVLPEEYPQRFGYPRPSGAGSLYMEQVIDGWEAATKLARYYSKDRKTDLARIQKYRTMLSASRVLMVSYHDLKGGPDAAGSIHFFWYRKAPKDWKKTLSKMPSGQGLHRIGPACELAPDFIGEANMLLKLYQEDLGR